MSTDQTKYTEVRQDLEVDYDIGKICSYYDMKLQAITELLKAKKLQEEDNNYQGLPPETIYYNYNKEFINLFCHPLRDIIVMTH